MRCSKCAKVRVECGGKTPEGWSFFSTGPSSEEPNHLYVFRSDEAVEGPINAVKLCRVEKPVSRI